MSINVEEITSIDLLPEELEEAPNELLVQIYLAVVKLRRKKQATCSEHEYGAFLVEQYLPVIHEVARRGYGTNHAKRIVQMFRSAVSSIDPAAL